MEWKAYGDWVLIELIENEKNEKPLISLPASVKEVIPDEGIIVSMYQPDDLLFRVGDIAVFKEIYTKISDPHEDGKEYIVVETSKIIATRRNE